MAETNRLHISELTLSDGSRVYDVMVPMMNLYAVSENDALALAQKIVEAIESHTVDEVEIVRPPHFQRSTAA